MESTNNSLNVIYLCTAEKGPSGGAKTIYNHSNLINKLNITNVTSEILHVKKRKITILIMVKLTQESDMEEQNKKL